jgi:SAM-dependent methyltransferase
MLVVLIGPSARIIMKNVEYDIPHQLNTEVDWLALWREIVEERALRREYNHDSAAGDPWSQKTDQFQEKITERWKKPDSTRRFILSQVNETHSVLDIGAGTGSWSLFLAPHVRCVTAVEASASMVAKMRDNINTKDINNIRILQGNWPDINVEKHDFSLCAHAVYAEPDFASFIRQMNAVTRDTCMLLIRVITPGSVLSEASQAVLGHPHYRPHFRIGYNALLQMRICPNVLMEDTGWHYPWQSLSLEDAVQKIKVQLRIEENTRYDDFLLGLVQRRLHPTKGVYVWPRDIRSALIYWSKENVITS